MPICITNSARAGGFSARLPSGGGEGRGGEVRREGFGRGPAAPCRSPRELHSLPGSARSSPAAVKYLIISRRGPECRLFALFLRRFYFFSWQCQSLSGRHHAGELPGAPLRRLEINSAQTVQAVMAPAERRSITWSGKQGQGKTATVACPRPTPDPPSADSPCGHARHGPVLRTCPLGMLHGALLRRAKSAGCRPGRL